MSCDCNKKPCCCPEKRISVSGKKGDKGDKGATGATGPAGPIGPAGPAGPARYDFSPLDGYVINNANGNLNTDIPIASITANSAGIWMFNYAVDDVVMKYTAANPDAGHFVVFLKKNGGVVAQVFSGLFNLIGWLRASPHGVHVETGVVIGDVFTVEIALETNYTTEEAQVNIGLITGQKIAFT